MTISQQINLINNNDYDNDITVTDVPNKHFLAVTENKLSSGSTTREITVDIMFLEQHPGGTVVSNSGLYTRSSNETSIKVTIKKDGNVLAENTKSY